MELAELSLQPNTYIGFNHPLFKDKKIKIHNSLLKTAGVHRPITFQYYTKGSEFLGGPGR